LSGDLTPSLDLIFLGDFERDFDRFRLSILFFGEAERERDRDLFFFFLEGGVLERLRGGSLMPVKRRFPLERLLDRLRERLRRDRDRDRLRERER